MTPRKNLIETKDEVLSLLLEEWLGNLFSANNGEFTYRFDINGTDLMLTFRFNNVLDISFTPRSSVLDIVKKCDALSIYNLSKGSEIICEWDDDGDCVY